MRLLCWLQLGGSSSSWSEVLHFEKYPEATFYILTSTIVYQDDVDINPLTVTSVWTLGKAK
jgi:hypothetical protein